MSTLLRQLLFGFAVSLCLVVPGVAEPQKLSPDDLRAAAQRAFEQGHFDVAFQAALALLERDGEDSQALTVLSQLERLTGQFSKARTTARLAWQHAQNDTQKYGAAMARAQVLASSGNRTMAQFWLRRAAEHAPTQGHAAVAREDFRYVRARNRLNLNFQLAVSPVSNINNGSKRSTGVFELPIFGVVEAELSGTGRALSGTEFLVGLAGRYRLRHTPGQNQTDLQLSASQRSYTLSSSAKALAPTAKGSDFSFADVQARLVHRGRTGGQEATPFQLSAALGQTWHGNAPYTRYTDLEATQTWAGQTQSFRLTAGARQDRSAVTSSQDALKGRVALSWMRIVGENNRLTLSVQGQSSSSDDINLEFQETGIGAQWSFGRPILSMDLGLGLNLSKRTYDQGPIAGQDRQDVSAEIAATATLRDFEMYGFMPTVTVTARQTESDFDQYDADEFGLRLGLRSSF
ncbi:MAG: DUF560 domain-containing protein [Pelagimonas sp.]